MTVDIQREIQHPEGRRLLIGRWRSGYTVAVFHKGCFHSIGGWDGSTGDTHIFRSGVRDGQDNLVRERQVQWCSQLPSEQLPSENIDPYWRD